MLDSTNSQERPEKQFREMDMIALAQLLEECKPWLNSFASKFLGPQLKVRVASSDIVQETNLQAIQGFDEFKGSSMREFRSWLKAILWNVIRQSCRHHIGQAKRSINLEVRVDNNNSSFAAGLASLADTGPSPSGNLASIERQLFIENNLKRLKPDQERAIRLRHFERLTIKEISAQMNRSEQSIVGLLRRGVRKLTEIFCTDNKVKTDE